MKPIAFYLPQFYPIPENDKWWGRGFTEWTNVTKATPRFKGHYQPHLPADLGFYDLRVADTIHKQAELARAYHLHGFCFYHYWFEGKTLLEEPVKLFTEVSDFPFCICWANQNWTRAWDGNERKVLLKQEYSHQDDIDHLYYLAKNYFTLKNYIKVDNKPVFIVYRTELFPDIKKTAAIWNDEIKKFGFDGLYLINIENLTYDYDPADIGFDAAIDFQPKGKNLPKRIGKNKLKDILFHYGLYNSVYYENYIWTYKDYFEANKYQHNPSYLRYPCVFPMWDNSSRREKNAWIFHDSKPEYFQSVIRHSIDTFEPPNEEENFLFINAWNEWAEGCHLEPCRKWGRGYLEIIRDAIKPAKS